MTEDRFWEFAADELDPRDWREFRAAGHKAIDDMVDYLETVRERPVWQSPSAEARAHLSASLPRQGRPLQEVYEDFGRYILPYPTGNIHPRFWGWVMGTGTPVGVLADLLTSVMNCHVSGYDQAAALVENQALEWLREIVDFPEHSSGLLVSGATAANLVAVTVARNSLKDLPIRQEGVGAAGQEHLTIYGSVATHSWVGRTCDLLGLGEKTFRGIAVDSRDRVNVEALRLAIEADRGSGHRPFCIVGNAGTVATGATDDLHALAELAKREGLWFHVDGAFGALAKLSPKYRHLVDGMERADSVAFDLHKWGYMQYETGAVIVRDAAAHKAAFTMGASYLDSLRGGIAVEPTEFASRGVQLSRGFRALKVWMNLSVYGSDRLGAVIEKNIEHVQYLKQRIDAESELERLGPAEMNVLCFRYQPRDLSEAALDQLNRELLVRLQESGIAVPSSARIGGRFAIRVANTNHRTRQEDFDLLVEAVLEIGRRLLRDESYR